MAAKLEYITPVIKTALDKKLITEVQHDKCKELLRKSNKLGLETSIEEIVIKQGYLSEDKVEELREIMTLSDGGEHFGRYQLQKLIGKGGMGKVYKAIHEFMGRVVAVKVINYNYMRDQSNATRFFQEIRALAKLNHPAITIIFDAGKVKRRYYFSMEYIDGPSLKDYVDKKKHLKEKEALRLILETSRGLAHAHHQNIVHRDVKPENIIITPDGKPKLTDFGVVMHHDEDHMTLTQEGMVVGSLYYASPEQIEGFRDIDGRSDIYSLGATLYYALTGRTIYTANSPQEILSKHLSGRWQNPRIYNQKISGRTIRLLKKMLAKNRNKRFQSMDQVVQFIEHPRMPKNSFFVILGIFFLLLLFLGMFLENSFHILDLFTKSEQSLSLLKDVFTQYSILYTTL